MVNKAIKQGFTIVEMLVVIFIIGILATMLMRTYSFMYEISFKIEQEKNITQEVIFISEILQNLADNNTIDYNKYFESDTEEGIKYIKNRTGVVEKLYLTGEDGEVSVYTTGNCIDPGLKFDIHDTIFAADDPDKIDIGKINCRLVIERNGKKTDLTNPKKVYLTKMLFKIIPFATDDIYFGTEGNNLCDITSTNYLSCPHRAGMWILGHAYSNTYGTKWISNVDIPIQRFFNLQ